MACSQLAHLGTVGALEAGTVRGTRTFGMLRCSGETPQADRQDQNPTSPRPPQLQVHLLEGQAAGRSAGGRKLWEATHAGASSRALSNLSFAGLANEERYPQMGTWGGWGTVKQEDWAGSACISARGRPQGQFSARAPGQGAGQQRTARLHTRPPHF